MPHTPAPDDSPIPDDDLERQLKVANPDDDALPHIGLAGGSYTVLVSGEDTLGRFTLIDMLVPDAGGPPPHRHDFEETFTVLEGEIEVTFRGVTATLHEGETANIPANAPHGFQNSSGKTAHLLCTCSPAGQERFFELVGDKLPSRDAVAPPPTPEAMAERGKRVGDLSAKYRTVMLGGPPS
jgi:quercetin dioxygenase-like cupin family protein